MNKNTLFAPALAATATLLLLTGVSLVSPRKAVSDPANPPVTPEQAAFFETKIRPILVESCQSCHGKDAELGGLRLDTRAATLKGGKTGLCLVAGDPDKSLLITAVRQTGALKMPQGGKLKPEEIAALEAWVKMGAPWPDTAAGPTLTGGMANPNWHSFWSLQPIRTPALPAVKNKKWAQTPVDAFVLAGLEAKGLTPAAPADRRTLLRRVTFDLTGLPPTPGETEAFLSDKSPNAYEKVVDRLLASPRYGEYWARHWMDVARYADTKGYVFVEDRAYPNAYTFRDWVIDSFNNDLPYDKFVTYQLAADLAPEVQSSDDKRPLAALGFLTVGRRFLNNQHDIIDDRIDVTMRGFEGMTVACARCHDHKFDPIPTADYYSLYGVFLNSPENTVPISPPAISNPWKEYNKQVQDTDNSRNKLILDEVKRLREVGKATPTALTEPVKKGLAAFRENTLPNDKELPMVEPGFAPDVETQLVALRKTLETLKAHVPQTPEMAMAVMDRPQPEQAFILKRGNPGNRGDAVPRRFLLCASPAAAPRPEWKEGSGRLDLAHAIMSKDNPLTARVFVNRVWLYHFGYGLVRTPSDFGKQGERPTHPELLDYLSSRFRDGGWSIKSLQRSIVLSATYRQDSNASEKANRVDPENRLLAHQNRRRLDLEQMRDALLYASGKLDTSKVGGPSVDLWKTPFSYRRAVYGYVERQNLPGTFRTFDFASPDATSPQRFKTTVPQQALYLMNSPFAVEQATSLASLKDVGQPGDDDARRIRRLYLRLFDRLPDADEAQVGLSYLHGPDTAALDSPALSRPIWQNGWGGYDDAAKRTTFTPFAVWDGEGMKWHTNKDYPASDVSGYAALSADGGHPGRDAAHGVIRRWTAPQDGTITVSGTLKHGNPGGDGVRARLVSNRMGLLGEWTAHNSEAKTDVARVDVRAGETLDFVVDCQGSDAFDSFQWSPRLKTTGTTGAKTVVWSAQRDFAGPLPAGPKPLTKWERYCQALLLTNEFMFVD